MATIKILALVLAMMMVLTMGVAFAADDDPATGSDTPASETPAAAPNPDTAGTFTYTEKAKTSTVSSLTVKNTGKTEHTFQLYQIFVGDVDANGVLSNLSWGTGVTAAGQTAYGDVSAKAKTLTDAAAAKAFADDLMNNSYLTGAVEKAKIAAGANAEWTGLNPGYYLVIDKAGTQTGEESAYTAYIMQVVGAVTREAKLDVPSVEKKVGDANDTLAKAITDPTSDEITWADSADYDFGDTIPFKLTGTLPSNFAEYETYNYKFTDTMTHLTYVDGSAKVFVVNGETKTEVGTGFTVAFATGTLTVEATNLKVLKDKSGADITVDKDSTILVTYQATLDDTAAIGPTGNPNVVTLTYSNNPNKGGEGDKGTTPEDKNIVFVYEIDANKVERDEAAGEKTEEEYNALEDKTGWVKDATTNKYYKTKALIGADFTLYKEVATGYVAKTGETVQTGAQIKAAYTNSSILAANLDNTKSYIVAGKKTGTSAGSKFNFAGIDDGTYVLVETTIPAGYNAIESMKVVVTATHTDGDEPKLTKLTVDNTSFNAATTKTTVGEGDDAQEVETPTGHIITDVENAKGATLPSTGGIGTTIFYVAGSLLVLAAAILLVTKRRMGSEE